MKKSTKTLLWATPSLLLTAVAAYLLNDDDELILPPDLDLHAPVSESCQKAYHDLEEFLAIDFGFTRLNQPLIRKSEDFEEKHREFLLKNADVILLNYDAIKPHTPALRTLADENCIAYPNTDFSGPLLRFQPIREVSRTLTRHWDLASYRGDLPNSTEDVLALYKIANSIARNSRNLAEAMIGMVITGQVLDSLNRSVESLSDDHLKTIIATIEAQPFSSEFVARVLIAEYCITANTLDSAIEQSGSHLFTKLAFNRNATLNVYSKYATNQIKLAQLKDWKDMASKTQELEDEFDSVHLKNWAGWRLISMAIPAVSKVFEDATDIEENQMDLIEEIHAKLAETDAT